MKNKIPIISIIIPVYNGEKCINNCIHSILNQTYLNYEIIVIDDGSIDATQNLCLQLAKTCSKLRYYYQLNEGAGAARNKGIEVSRGKYLAFVDADDYLNPRYLEELYSLVEIYDVKLSCCAYLKGTIDHVGDFLCSYPKGSEKIMNRNQALLSLFYRREIMGYPYVKLIEKELIGNTRFSQELRLGEDFTFTYEILKKINRVAYTSKVLYYYVQNPQGITHNLSSLDMEVTWEYMKTNIYTEMKEESEELKKAVISKLFILALDFIVKLKGNDKVFKRELTNFIRKNRVDVLKDIDCKKTNRILAAFSCISINLTIQMAYIFTSLSKRLGLNLKRAL